MEALPLLHLGGLKNLMPNISAPFWQTLALPTKKWNGLKRLKGQKGLYRLMFTNRSRSLP
jgi:hypothetical protein